MYVERQFLPYRDAFYVHYGVQSASDIRKSGRYLLWELCETKRYNTRGMCVTCLMLLVPLMCLSSKLIKVSAWGAAHVYNLIVFSVSHVFYLLHEFLTLSSNVSLLLAD